jgi:hypothetical protein
MPRTATPTPSSPAGAERGTSRSGFATSPEEDPGRENEARRRPIDGGPFFARRARSLPRFHWRGGRSRGEMRALRGDPAMRAPKKSETLEVRLPFETKTAFMALCRARGRSASDAVRGFIEAEIGARGRLKRWRRRTHGRTRRSNGWTRTATAWSARPSSRADPPGHPWTIRLHNPGDRMDRVQGC